MGQLDLNIAGYPTIRVDDSFNNLSPQEQQSTVDEILASLQSQQGDTSLGTAFKFGELQSRADTQNFAADVNQLGEEGLYGKLTRAGQEYIGNPVREALGFDAIDPNYAQNKIAQQREQADNLQAQADALNYESLTTKDVSGPVSAVQYGSQKIAESLPYMATAMAMPVVTPLVTSAEVNASLAEIEDLPLNERVSLATKGGVLMAALENIGAGVIVKGMPKELIGKLGVNGVTELLQKKGLGRVVQAFTAGAVAEGITETGQEAIKIAAESQGGKEFTEGEIPERLKESFFAGGAAGGGIRGTAQTGAETLDVVSNMDGLSKIHGGDKEALADVARDINQLDSEYDDRKSTKRLDDAENTIRDLHTAYMKQFDEAKARAKAAGVDVNTAAFKTAERRAKNRAKNEASNEDIKFLQTVDPELASLARRLNVITRFTQQGVKGGISRITDLLNPIEGLKKSGSFGRGVGGMQSTGASVLGMYTGGATVGVSVGGRIIDAATGSRNRVAKAIKKYGTKPGIDTSAKGETQRNEINKALDEVAKLKTRQASAALVKAQKLQALKTNTQPPVGGGPEGTMFQVTGLNRQQVAIALRRLKRTRPDLIPTIEQYQKVLEGKQDKVGDTPNQFYNLQNAVKKAAQDLGMEGENANAVQVQQGAVQGMPNTIKNPIAYQSAVDNAMRTAEVAVQNAPTPALAQRANEIANARSQVAKKALIEQTLQENPQYADYVNNILRPMANFGPENVQESRFPNINEPPYTGRTVRSVESTFDLGTGDTATVYHGGTPILSNEVIYTSADPTQAEVYAIGPNQDFEQKNNVTSYEIDKRRIANEDIVRKTLVRLGYNRANSEDSGKIHEMLDPNFASMYPEYYLGDEAQPQLVAALKSMGYDAYSAIGNNVDPRYNLNYDVLEIAVFNDKQESRFPGAEIIAEEIEAAKEMYNDRVMALHHGTSKKAAQQIDEYGFATSKVFGTAVPEQADSYAQAVLNVPDNGRITMMFPEKVFDNLKKNKLINIREYTNQFGVRVTEYELNKTALDKADVFRSRSLHKSGNKITDTERAQLIADALGHDFKVQLNASDDAYYRRQQLITLTANGDKRKTLHEIFHAVEDRLTSKEMQILQNTPTFKQVMQEVEELYPELNTSAKMLEGLAETSARLQALKGEETSKVKYIIAKIKDLIEAFKNMIDGAGFNTVNNILDDIYTGKTYQQGVNEGYAQLYVPDIAYAKKDKPGGPMVAKRLKALNQIEEQAAVAKQTAGKIDDEYNTAMDNIAANLNLPGVTGTVLRRAFNRVTPSTDLGMIASDFLKGLGVLDEQGISQAEDVEAEVLTHQESFLAVLKALQKAKIIGDFGLAFRTSAGGRLYPVHMLEPLLPELQAKANLNNVRKFENRAKPTHWEGKIEINSHPLGSYENTKRFIEREQKQALVINDKIYEMMDKMQSTPQTHRGLDLIYKKDGTTDSAYTLASAEALKQYKDNQNDTGGMTPIFMKRKAQDRLRVDTLNGSASYQGKAGKGIWEFPNWEALGETGFEQFVHALRDHFGLPSELPYSERVGFLFGTVAQYLETAGRPISDSIPQSDLDMPLIDYMVNAYGQEGSNVYSHTRGGTPKLFLDKNSGVTLYQKNHAIFDVAEHGFEMQRAAVELGRMRAFLENAIPDAKKIPSSELFMMPEAQQALQDFKSSYPVWFDGTSSSYQLHAVLTGDPNLAQETNIGPFDPDAPGGDLYRPGAEYLQRMLELPQSKTRKITKKFIANRRSYGQVKLTAMKSGADEIAKSVPSYGERTETGQWPQEIKDNIKQIQNDLETEFDSKFPGAAMAEGISRAIAGTLFDLQGKRDFAVRVPLPDGDVAVYTGKLPDSAKKRVIYNIDKERRIAVPVYKDKVAITGFAAFLNHSLDAYVQRELAKRLREANVSGFMHTHDAFAVHAQHGIMMREIYWQIMREIAANPIYRNVAQANGLDPNSITVKYNITTDQGGQTIQMPLSEMLDRIDQQKSETFGQEQTPNYYALS